MAEIIINNKYYTLLEQKSDTGQHLVMDEDGDVFRIVKQKDGFVFSTGMVNHHYTKLYGRNK